MARRKSAKPEPIELTVLYPVQVRILDPAAAFQSYLDNWGDDLDDKEHISDVDLLQHAYKAGVLQVPDGVIHFDKLAQQGLSEDDEFWDLEALGIKPKNGG